MATESAMEVGVGGDRKVGRKGGQHLKKRGRQYRCQLCKETLKVFHPPHSKIFITPSVKREGAGSIYGIVLWVGKFEICWVTCFYIYSPPT